MTLDPQATLPSPAELRGKFLLDPSVTFLNHGSFGACPASVFAVYQEWQRTLEYQPVEFLGRRFDTLLNEAREPLAAYLNVPAERVVYIVNATMGVNIAARSLALQPGDEILTTNMEYGACMKAWQFVAQRTGAVIVERRIDLPVESQEAFVEQVWGGVTPRTRVLYLSHISAPSALIYPVSELCRRAREAGIISIIDGAHAPGQIPVDLAAIDPDFYTGNCHKWLCAPKGAAFLYVRPEFHGIIQPPVISWNYAEDADLVARVQQQGTRDIAAFLSVPAAIRFQAEHQWNAVRARCHALASDLRARLAELTDLPPLSPDSPDWYSQMFTAALPPLDGDALKRRLYDEFRVEVPIWIHDGQPFMRVSFQGYNDERDSARLLEAMTVLLPQLVGV